MLSSSVAKCPLFSRKSPVLSLIDCPLKNIKRVVPPLLSFSFVCCWCNSIIITWAILRAIVNVADSVCSTAKRYSSDQTVLPWFWPPFAFSPIVSFDNTWMMQKKAHLENTTYCYNMRLRPRLLPLGPKVNIIIIPMWELCKQMTSSFRGRWGYKRWGFRRLIGIRIRKGCHHFWIAIILNACG